MVTEALKLRSNKHVSKPITACLPAWLLHQWHSHGMATLFMMSSQNPTKELHTLAKPRNWHLKQSLDGVLCFGLGFTHSLFQGSSVSPQGYVCDFIMCILNVLFMSWQADVLPYYHYTLLLYCHHHSPENWCLHTPSPPLEKVLRPLNETRVCDTCVRFVVIHWSEFNWYSELLAFKLIWNCQWDLFKLTPCHFGEQV